MPSRSDIRAVNSANRDIATLVTSQITAFWRGVDVSTPESAREALNGFVPELVRTYGEAAALVAANFYDDLRDKARAKGSFQAVLADPVAVAQVQGMIRWAVGPLAGEPAYDTEITNDAGARERVTVPAVPPDPRSALKRVTLAAVRLARQPGRLTIADNARRDPAKARWARVPSGKTCAFCSLLASRGAVYQSRDTAGMRHYHDDCDCEPTPMWDGDDYPEGYDPDALYSQYQAARADAGSGQVKPILSALRQQQGIA